MNSDELIPRLHHDEDPASSSSSETGSSIAAKIAIGGATAYGLGLMTCLGIESGHGIVYGLKKLCSDGEDKKKQ